MLSTMKRSGFTIVEVLITMVILTVLLTLGVVGLRTTQANGRDAERKADIEAIAVSLERRYERGNPADLTNYRPGSYPGTNELWHGPYYSNNYSWEDVFTGLPASARLPPTKDTNNHGLDSTCLLYFYNLPTCDKAEKDSVIQAIYAKSGGGWYDKYVYEYIGPNGGYCNHNECVRYNLYWISETDKTVYKGIPGLKVRKSKHQ